MKAEDLKTKLDKIDSSATKEDVDALKKEFSTGLEGIKASLAALTTPREPEPVIEPGDPAVDMLSDPKKFVKNETDDIRKSQLENTARLEEMRARQNPKFAPIFRQYGAEIDALVAKVPLSTRAMPNYWESSLRMFIGDKMMKGEVREGFPSLLGSSSLGPDADGNENDPNFGFEPEMARFFKERGRDLSKMRKLSDLMVRDGETLTIQAKQQRLN